MKGAEYKGKKYAPSSAETGQAWCVKDVVEKRSPEKACQGWVRQMLNQQADSQTKHQMIARINKDFVPACRYGLGGLHDGEHVQLPSCTNSALGLGVRPLGQTACIA